MKCVKHTYIFILLWYLEMNIQNTLVFKWKCIWNSIKEEFMKKIVNVLF